MKEEDYAKALPFLFGEDLRAKVRMEEVITLSQPFKGKEKAGFHGATLERTQETMGVAN